MAQARAKRTTGDPNINPLDLGQPGGALNLPPGMRKPTRGALGGSAPRGARTRMPPALAAAQRGGKKTPKRKVTVKNARNKANG
jgi:hypothetical protein